MSDLRQLLEQNSASMREVQSHLDSLGNAARIAQTRSLSRRHLSCLFDLAQGFSAIDLDFYVPRPTPLMQEVVHYGKNSLGVFTQFAKVFVRPAQAAELWGYNRNQAWLQTVVGPGYFVARPHTVPGEVLIDYCTLPKDKPAGWPAILPNSARLSYFVYRDTQDILRGVSQHVSIGRATKKGKVMSAWFILCRSE